MKKTFLTLAMALGLVGAAQAQQSTFGVKAGASLTSYTGGGSTGAEYKFGFNGGLLANFAVNDAFSIQPELLYSMKGAKGSSNFFGPNIDITQTLHYIDVPVLARINASGLFFEIGPQVGFLVAANTTASSGTNSQSKDIKSLFNTVDFGYAAGLGYQVANGPGVGLRYNGGLTDVVKGSNNSSDATRNSAFQLYVSYMFGGK